MLETTEILHAKQKLDSLIAKQRVHMYKPIQVAEILYHVRLGTLTIQQLREQPELYRNWSKKWRDDISRRLLEQVSTSSQKFQDNLFDTNAMPPKEIAVLAEANDNGIVERYIYLRFYEKQKTILRLLHLLEVATPQNFSLDGFLAYFEKDRGIKRSIDKAFEIVVYALFNTLVRHLHINITVSADVTQLDLLGEFEEFAHLLLGIDRVNPVISFRARLYRAGATNAADRGLDMWANFGPVVQVKHVTLTEDLAEDIATGIAADNVVIVCKDSELAVINRVSSQIGPNIQGIITQNQLVDWYNQALRGTFSNQLGNDLLESLRWEYQREFPFSQSFQPFFEERNYHQIQSPESPFWIEYVK